MPKRKDDFVPYLGFKMGTDGEPDATQKAVADWVNNNVENKRKIIYVPLDNRVRNKELVGILTSAKKFIGSLSIDDRQALIVLFGFERRAPCFFRIILWIRNKCRKKPTSRGVSFLQMPSKLGKRDVDHWLSKFHELYPISYRDELKEVCNEKFPAHKKWCYEDLWKLLKATLIETRTKITV